MPTRAVKFFKGTVKPTVEEYFASPLDIRRGRLAAIVLYHMTDYWVVENSSTIDKLKVQLKVLVKELIEECPDFLIVRDIANASKHDQLTNNPDPSRKLTSSEQVAITSGIFDSPLNTVELNEASSVIFTLDDGTARPLLGVLRSALHMWEAKIGES